MSDDARRKLLREIQATERDLKRETEDAQAEFTQEQGKVGSEIGNKLLATIQKYSIDKASRSSSTFPLSRTRQSYSRSTNSISPTILSSCTIKNTQSMVRRLPRLRQPRVLPSRGVSDLSRHPALVHIEASRACARKRCLRVGDRSLNTRSQEPGEKSAPGRGVRILRAVSPFLATLRRANNRVCADTDRNAGAPEGPPGSLPGRKVLPMSLDSCVALSPVYTPRALPIRLQSVGHGRQHLFFSSFWVVV